MNLRYPKNVHFECQRCAKCCGDGSHRGRNILLLESEVKQISKATGMRPLSFASRSLSIQSYRYRMKKRGGKCVFLDGKACRIYNIRPLICRSYPFSLRKKENGYVFEVSRECPGIGLGRVFTAEDFGEMLEKARSKLGTA